MRRLLIVFQTVELVSNHFRTSRRQSRDSFSSMLLCEYLVVDLMRIVIRNLSAKFLCTVK